MVVEHAPHAVLLILALSLLVSRIGAVGFEMTGLSPDVASFQATSAFSGAGFTTEEAELITATAGRRKMTRLLILGGNVGLATAFAALVLSFSNGGGDLLTLVYIAAGAVLVIAIARTRWLNRMATPMIRRVLDRTTDLEIKDYSGLLGLRRGYRVAEIDVQEGT